MRVGGDEPKVTGSLTQATDVPAAIPPYEPPSPPLTPDDRMSVRGDLDQQRAALARHADTEPLTGRFKDWADRYWMFAQEIRRLEQTLEEDFAHIEQGCLDAVIAGEETWERFKEDAEQQMGIPWAEIKVLLDERSDNRKLAATP